MCRRTSGNARRTSAREEFGSAAHAPSISPLRCSPSMASHTQACCTSFWDLTSVLDRSLETSSLLDIRKLHAVRLVVLLIEGQFMHGLMFSSFQNFTESDAGHRISVLFSFLLKTVPYFVRRGASLEAERTRHRRANRLLSGPRAPLTLDKTASALK